MLCFFITSYRQRVTCPAMAQKPGMSHDERTKLQELLGHAQQSGLVGEALVAMGLGDGLAQQVGSEIENSQQTVVRPKAKAKQSGMGTKDGPSAAEDFGYTLVTSEGLAPAAMTDASKRLYDAVDDGVGDAGTSSVDASATIPPTPMNRTMRAWQMQEGNLSAPNAPSRRTNVPEVRALASSAGVPESVMRMANALDRANPGITLEEAKRLYPSIPLDNGNVHQMDQLQQPGLHELSSSTMRTMGCRSIHTQHLPWVPSGNSGTLPTQSMVRYQSPRGSRIYNTGLQQLSRWRSTKGRLLVRSWR